MQHLKAWSKDFPKNDIGKKIITVHKTIRKLIVNEVWRETLFKIIHRTNIPFIVSPTDGFTSQWPNALSFTNTSFVDCPIISGFWNQLLDFFTVVTKHKPRRMCDVLNKPVVSVTLWSSCWLALREGLRGYPFIVCSLLFWLMILWNKKCNWLLVLLDMLYAWRFHL